MKISLKDWRKNFFVLGVKNQLEIFTRFIKVDREYQVTILYHKTPKISSKVVVELKIKVMVKAKVIQAKVIYLGNF